VYFSPLWYIVQRNIWQPCHLLCVQNAFVFFVCRCNNFFVLAIRDCQRVDRFLFVSLSWWHLSTLFTFVFLLSMDSFFSSISPVFLLAKMSNTFFVALFYFSIFFCVPSLKRWSWLEWFLEDAGFSERINLFFGSDKQVLVKSNLDAVTKWREKMTSVICCLTYKNEFPMFITDTYAFHKKCHTHP
jgi:hypothetical protein